MSALLKRPTIKTLNTRNGSNLYESDTYLSNGHWLVAKSRIKPAVLDFIRSKAVKTRYSEGLRTMPDADLSRVIPSGDLPEWTVTDEVRTDSRGLAYRMLYSSTVAAFAGIDVKYADWLGLVPGAVAYAKDHFCAFRTTAGDVVMPVRLD